MNIKNNCKRATILIEKRQSGNIALPDLLFLQLHLFGCQECRIYKKQSRQIDKLVRNLLESSSPTQLKLNEFFKHHLREQIKKEIDKVE